MTTLYEQLNNIVTSGKYFRFSTVKALNPLQSDSNREVKGNANRGGFETAGLHIPSEEYKLTCLSILDTKVKDHAKDKYGYTSVTVVQYAGSFKFKIVNPIIEYATNQGIATFDLSQCENIFPVPTINYTDKKIELILLEIEKKHYEKIRTGARKYFANQNISLNGYFPKSYSEGSGNVPVKVEYHNVEFFPNDLTLLDCEPLSDSEYRTKEGRSFVYHLEPCGKLDFIIEELSLKIKELRQVVRLAECYFIEHSTCPEGWDWQEVTCHKTIYTTVENAAKWEAKQENLQNN